MVQPVEQTGKVPAVMVVTFMGSPEHMTPDKDWWQTSHFTLHSKTAVVVRGIPWPVIVQNPCLLNATTAYRSIKLLP